MNQISVFGKFKRLKQLLHNLCRLVLCQGVFASSLQNPFKDWYALVSFRNDVNLLILLVLWNSRVVRGAGCAKRKLSDLVDAWMVNFGLHLVQLNFHFEHYGIQLVLATWALLKLWLLNNPQRPLYLRLLVSDQKAFEILIRLQHFFDLILR